MIYNSLGSNYDLRFVIKSLFGFGAVENNEKLINLLDNKYGGETKLLYKGRGAIYLALKTLDLPRGTKVGINGFTCYVVYKAVVDSGYKPIYLDIDGRSLNFSLSELKDKGKDLKVLIIQNTLGNPCNMVNIKKYCEQNNISLIEDLAHSVGTIYSDGQEAGTVGDFTALSFSQDKMIDAVSGGTLIVRNKKFQKKNLKNFPNLKPSIYIKDRFYPLFTFLIRNLYSIGIGKLLHFGLKELGILSQPVEGDENISPHKITGWHSGMAIEIFMELNKNLTHRRKIAKVYAENLDKEILSADYVEKINSSSCIRFPIFVKNRQDLVDQLRGKGIFISDVWYDAPIAPVRFMTKTTYGGECQVSEKISLEIVNLPTHLNVTESDAKKICSYINKWLNTK